MRDRLMITLFFLIPSINNYPGGYAVLKMNVEFDEGADIKSVMKQVRKNCKNVEDDCEVYI